MMDKPIQIMLVDDHLLFREGIASLLKRDERFQILCEADTGRAALEIIKTAKPDVVLMDVKMPDMDGISTTRKMLALYPDLKVIMITASEKEDDLFEAVKAGAQGYVLKTVTDSNYMRDAIFRVAAGEAIIPPGMVPRLLGEFATLANEPSPLPDNKAAEKVEKKLSPLTKREYQVLELVAQGLTNKEIGKKLVISENTVRSHLRFILDKLHINNRVQAAIWFENDKRKRLY
jgi:two-component system NarL family response regulator